MPTSTSPPLHERELSRGNPSIEPTVLVPGKPKRFGLPAGVTRSRFVWSYVITFIVVHALGLLAFVPWLFSWCGLLAVPLGVYVFATFGINLAYHRVLTHQGLVLPKWLERTFATCGMCCLMQSPARWVAIHRMHHKHSDDEADPHSPLAGFIWSHLEWLIRPNPATSSAEMFDRYAKDIIRDPYYYRCERYGWWWKIYITHAILFWAAFTLIGRLWLGNWALGIQFGMSMFVWGVIVRTIYVWHVTWAVNSISHLWGYRNYRTTDDSRNNWIVALATNGEGWHNNHHADQVACSHGHRWWEFDVTYLTIRLLEMIGLATNVKRPKGVESA